MVSLVSILSVLPYERLIVVGVVFKYVIPSIVISEGVMVYATPFMLLEVNGLNDWNPCLAIRTGPPIISRIISAR